MFATGPKPDWDCDIVETLDDAYTEHFDPAQKKEDLENPEDFMEEDFFAKLVGNDDAEGWFNKLYIINL